MTGLGPVIGDLLPIAVGVAISPIPVIAAILALLSPRARTTSVAFLLGWTVGLVSTVIVFALLGGLIEHDAGASRSIVGGIIQLVLGAAALVLAIRQWRSRPRSDDEATLPTWMAAIDEASPGKTFGLAFILGSVNPKNLLLAMAAGLTLGGATGLATQLIALAVYAVVASLTIAVPVIAFLVATERLAPALERLRVWLIQNNAAVMTVLFLVIGASLIGRGLQAF